MRFYSKILGITLSAMTLGLASCSNDLNETDLTAPSQNNGVLVKAPRITAWSGSQTFGEGTRAEAVDELAPITQDEIDAARAFFCGLDGLSARTAGQELSIEDLAGWKHYYVQNVTAGNKIPNDWAMMVGTNNETVSNIAVWNLDPDEVFKLLKTDAYLSHEAKVPLTDLEEGDSQLVVNCPIKDFTFETTGTSFSNVYYEGVRISGYSGIWPNCKLATIDGFDGVFMALYGYTDSNNGFWDRIIKLTKTDVADAPELEEDETEGDVFESDKILHNNEVEVNLSVQDVHDNYSVEDLITKLSIHVRHAGDVKVRIPVPVETLVPADDLAIVLSHPELMYQYGKDNHAEFLIGNNLVELSVDFTEAMDCAGNGYGYYIEVTTKGINKDVIAYCQKNYGDGVNFEVWNYFQWNTEDANGEMHRRQPTAEEINTLKIDWLDDSTIEFGYDNGAWNAYINMRDYPYYFINAFNNDRDRENAIGNVNVMDCYVHIIGNQGGSFENLYEGSHLNGSDRNVIYIRDDIFGTDKHDDAHRQH